MDVSRNTNFKCFNSEAHKNGDKNPSMGYMQDAHKLHCFTCNTNYDLLDLVQQDYGLDSKEAYKQICNMYNIQDISYMQDIPKNAKVIPLKQPTANEMQTEETPVKKNFDFTSAILNIEKKQTEEGLKHFKARGLTDETISKYHLCYADKFNEPMKDYKDLEEDHKGYTNYETGEVLDGYYLLPFMDKEGKLSYFTAETVHRGEMLGDFKIPKYRKIKHLEAPYFNERYLHTGEEIIYIVEGIYDALSIEQAGHKAIALVGTAHNRLLKLIDDLKPTSTFIIALDNDEAGKQNAENLQDELAKRNIPHISYSRYIQHIQDIEDICKCKDANEMLLSSSSSFTRLLEDVEKEAENVKLEEYLKETADAYLSDFMLRINTDNYKPIATPFKKLNNALGGGFLKQSIVCVGGGTSTGKTTFCLQLADDLLAKHKMIYYSLEMSKDQVLAKLLSLRGYMQRRKAKVLYDSK